MARPRIKDVARRAGVSEKTVSNVINDYVHVSDRTRHAVREAIEELGYRVNLAGRHLRRGRTGIVALVLPELDFPYFGELAAQVILEAERRSLTTLVHQTRADRTHEFAALDGFGSDFVDGLLLSPLSLTAQDFRAHAFPLPTVLLGESVEQGVGADHVAIDNVVAAREATEHLLGLGRRRIAVIGGRDASGAGTAELRTLGYRAAIEAAGLAYDPGAIVPVREFRMPDGAAAAARLLAGDPRPDALLCLNDQMALGALRVLHEQGVRVPEDVAVVGFDDVEGGRFSVPTLTTVSPDKAAVARVAVELLVRRIAEPAGEPAPAGAGPGGPEAPGGADAWEAADGAGAAAESGSVAGSVESSSGSAEPVESAAFGGGSRGAERAPAARPAQQRVVPHRLAIRESTVGRASVGAPTDTD